MKQTLYALIFLAAGFFGGQTLMYYTTVKPLHKSVNLALEKTTYSNSNDFGKIKVKKEGTIDLNVISEINSDSALTEGAKRGFLGLFKKKHK